MYDFKTKEQQLQPHFTFCLFFQGWALLSALPAPVHAVISVTTSTFRDMSGSSVWSDSVLKAKAGVSAPRSHFALDSLSSSTWERWLANRSLGEFIGKSFMNETCDGRQILSKNLVDVRSLIFCTWLFACFTSLVQDLTYLDGDINEDFSFNRSGAVWWSSTSPTVATTVWTWIAAWWLTATEWAMRHAS